MNFASKRLSNYKNVKLYFDLKPSQARTQQEQQKRESMDIVDDNGVVVVAAVADDVTRESNAETPMKIDDAAAIKNSDDSTVKSNNDATNAATIISRDDVAAFSGVGNDDGTKVDVNDRNDEANTSSAIVLNDNESNDDDEEEDNGKIVTFQSAESENAKTISPVLPATSNTKDNATMIAEDDSEYEEDDHEYGGAVGEHSGAEDYDEDEDDESLNVTSSHDAVNKGENSTSSRNNNNSGDNSSRSSSNTANIIIGPGDGDSIGVRNVKHLLRQSTSKDGAHSRADSEVDVQLDSNLPARMTTTTTTPRQQQQQQQQQRSNDIKRKRKNTAACVIDFVTFLKYVMMKHKYLLHHNKPITQVNPELFYEDIETLKLDCSSKLKLQHTDTADYVDYDVNSHESSNHQRMLLVSSLSIALERKNVAVVYSISYLKFLMATFSTFLRNEHFMHVQRDAIMMPPPSLPPNNTTTTTTMSNDDDDAANSTDVIVASAAVSGSLGSTVGGGASAKRNKHQSKLASGAILFEYAKNYGNFAVSVSKATRNDLEGLYYMRTNKMTLNRSMLNIMLLRVAHKLVETRDRIVRENYVAVNITQMKHMFICVTAHMYCVWEDDRFVLPTPSLEREITADALNDVKLDGNYAILEVAVGHGTRMIIDVLETSHASLAEVLKKPYCEKIAQFRHYFGPKWTPPSTVEQTMDSHSAYVQLPNSNVDPDGNVLERYYHAKPLHTVCAFGLCGSDVLIAYHKGDNEFEYKLSVPNNTTLNITFMVMRFDTVKRAISAGSSTAPPTNATGQQYVPEVRLIDNVLTYAQDPTMRIHEFGQVLTAENRRSIVLFHKPLKVTIHETVKLNARTDTEYTHISEFRPPQPRENAGALRKRSYFENAIATCSEDELREQLRKRFKTSNDMMKFLQQALSLSSSQT